MRSFDADPAQVGTGPLGQKAHRRHIAHSERLERRLYAPRPGVWRLVGNGLSNQTFIEGLQGLIAIDTGESVEEMRTALAEVRAHTSALLAAVLYSHFHYIGGTRAALDEAGGRDLLILGHERIPLNLARTSGEIGPAYSRGLIHPFGLRLPPEGPDALVNEGLGLNFRNPEHSPFTPGYVPPTEFFRGGERLTLAGLTVEVHHAPSDADDSVTFWFPELSTCVQNLVWPTLFNIFAIRGEEYRDPQVLLAGIDHILTLGAEHLLGTHGPPISGAAGIAARVTRYRDSIQFLWDQTVRGLNRGLTADALAHEVRLRLTALLLAAGALTSAAAPALADPCRAVPQKGPMPASPAKGERFSGPVMHVGDGDSLCVAVGPRRGIDWVEVRLADFHAPELKEPGGRKARDTLKRLTAGRRVDCVSRGRTWDRVAADCRLGGRSLGERMRAAGVAEGGRGRGEAARRR